MGYITGAFGVKGFVKVQPLTQTPESLLDYPVWWIEDGRGGWQSQTVDRASVHVEAVVAQLQGLDDREQAARLRGRQVAVSRADFPEAEEGEYYWADLIGLSVVNEQAEALGEVTRVFETGANDVLVVEGDRERLIPFIASVVKEVDLAARVVRVDWGLDY